MHSLAVDTAGDRSGCFSCAPHEFNQVLIRTIPLGIDILDEEGHILYLNERLESLVGKDAVGKTCSLVYRNGCPCSACPLCEGIEIGKTKHVEVEILDGRTFSITYTGMNCHNTKAVLRIFEDITERKRTEEQLCQMHKLEAVGKLAGGVAHDFNNLLTAITGYSELLLLRLSSRDPIRDDIERIHSAAERAAALTHQLLAFSRRQMLQPVMMDLNALIKDMRELLVSLTGENVRLITALDASLGRIKADAGQIGQVIMNLVLNARDAMPEGGKLIITTENTTLDKNFCRSIPAPLPGEFVCLTVEDTGPGIPKEISRQVFDPFFSTKGTGNGLGLSVVYGIVRQHEGCIKILSDPGHGSAVKVYLPAVSTAPEIEKGESIPPGRPDGSGERILLIEDEEAVRALAATVLRENGYMVFEAANAKEALDVFEKQSGGFSLIFSDVVLPDTGGVQLVDRLRTLKPDLKVLFSSGYADQKSQWPAIQEQGFPFLQKPYSITDLLQAVKKAC